MLKLLTLSEDQPAWPTVRQKPASAVDAAPSQLLRQLTNADALVRPVKGLGGSQWDVSTKASVGASEVVLVQSAITLTQRLAELATAWQWVCVLITNESSKRDHKVDMVKQ